MYMHVAYHVPPLQALTEDDPLHIILDELGPPGKQLSYSMNATICLSLTNRWDHSKGMLCPCLCVLFVWLCVLVYLCVGLAMYWSDVLVIIGLIWSSACVFWCGRICLFDFVGWSCYVC